MVNANHVEGADDYFGNDGLMFRPFLLDERTPHPTRRAWRLGGLTVRTYAAPSWEEVRHIHPRIPAFIT